ncbi:MAG: helix-turn-helix domain-containing protein [Bryobacteraceae bacterium]
MALKKTRFPAFLTMASVGRILRGEREQQGLPLSAVSTRTKISQTILEAIECDEIAHIPSAFLYRSFVRQVASVLSVDFTQIAGLVNSVAERFPAVLVPGQDRRPTGVRPIAPRPERASTWISSIFSLLAVVTICSGLYAYLQRVQFPGSAPIIKNPQPGIVNAAPEPHPAPHRRGRDSLAVDG